MLSPSNPTSAGLLSYTLATPAQREQALIRAKQSLQRQFPGFDDDQWADMFAAYAPEICIETGEAELEYDMLVGFANWVDCHQTSSEDVPIYGHGAYYLARNLVSYSESAKELLAADPELSRPESIDLMRALFSRLSVGNSVAEQIYQNYQKPIGR